jgi:hypothetical protein
MRSWVVANSCMSLHGRFERRHGVRIGRNKREAGKSFLTTRMSLGGREGGGEDDVGESTPTAELQRVATASSIGRKGTGEGGWGARCECEGGRGEALGVLV